MMFSFLQKFITPNKSDSDSNKFDSNPVESNQSHFVLPIHTLADVHPVPVTVLADLELSESQSQSDPMNHYLYSPSTPFGKRMATKLSSVYTTDIPFLQSSQSIVESLSKPNKESLSKSVPDTLQGKSGTDTLLKSYEESKLLEMLEDFKDPATFMEKYNYVEWEALEHVNRSSTFLQGVSILNGIVPLSNVLMTFVILLIPLVVIFFYGKELSIGSYLEHLRVFGRDNMFSQLFAVLEPGTQLNLQTSLTLLAGFLLYAYQLYFNIQCTIQFFTHLSTISQRLCQTRAFLASTRAKLMQFILVASGKSRYEPFVDTCRKRLLSVDKILDHLQRVCPASYNLNTLANMGYLFECYYLLYADEDYKSTLAYCMDFDGYYDCLASVSEKYVSGSLAKCSFGTSVSVDLSSDQIESKSPVYMKGLYYPTFVNKISSAIRNDVDLTEQNYIITGPNASGKTTLLKTVAINVLLSQQVGFGFFSEGHIAQPYNHFHSYINIPDTSERDSLFEAETRRCKDILTQIENSPTGDRHFCIFDELFSGTNPDEASSSAYSYLKYLCKQEQVDFVLTTHYLSVCQKVEEDHAVHDSDADTVSDTASDANAESESDKSEVIVKTVSEEKSESDNSEDKTEDKSEETDKALLKEGIVDEERVKKEVSKEIDNQLSKVVDEEVSKVLESKPKWDGRDLVNYRMKVDHHEDKLLMKYKLEPGISEIKGARYILANMGFPEEMMRSL